MKKLPEFLFDISRWGAFKIPAFSLGAVALLLIFRDVNNPKEILFIQELIRFSIGSAIISYCQSLGYSTYRLNAKKEDLPIYIQVIFMILHVSWFIYWLLIKNA
ncbi:hypothetical protein ACMUMQ_06480 [Marinomonas sp. 2405UD66-6]|uniref:hypothetical protein n=1 Tax=Marinomonas sp. 2405UD66-6 TaxID=3391834 RepID=UPI0039C94F45